MPRLTRFLGGLTALFRRTRAEQELDEELRAYLAASVDAKIEAGMTRDDAERAARIEFGGLEAVKDETRDAGWETSVEQLWRDVRYAARTLRKSPAFSAVVILTLTLGIGANTSIFSAVNAILLRALPVERPDELIALTALYPNGPEPFSYPAYRTLATDGARVADALAASTTRREAVAIDGPPEAVDLKWVSGNYFTALGVPAATGRLLIPADDPQPPGVAVTAISEAFWTRRFGRDPAVIGRGVRLRGTTFVIVGVVGRGFTSETPGESVDLWMPLTSQPGAPGFLWNGHSSTWLRVLARRRPGVDLAQARAALDSAYVRVRDDIAAKADTAKVRESALASRLDVAEASRGVSRMRDTLATPLIVLMAIVGLVLLVACANLATLMLTRAVARRPEIAMCLALGAGRARLIRQGTIEALMLAALGGAGGFLVAFWGTSVIASLMSGVLPMALDIHPDARVLAFAATAACATAVFFGLLPTLFATRVEPHGALDGGKRSGRGGRGIRGASSGSRSSRVPFGRTLVAIQIAVSLVLLLSAGLFVRSLMNLKEIDLGFDPARVVLFPVRPTVSGAQAMPPDMRRQLIRDRLERAASVPGVEAVSASSSGLLSSDRWRNVVAVDGFTPPEGVTPRSWVNAITPAYFDVTRIALLRGRAFSDGDGPQTPKAAIVNEAFVRQFIGGPSPSNAPVPSPEASPLGRRVSLCRSDPCDPSTATTMEIVGVVENAKYSDLREIAPPMLYIAFTQHTQNLNEIQVRATGDADVASTLYRALAAGDGRLAITGMMSASERVEASLVAPAMAAKLSSAFGLLALALAAVGLSGLVAYMTTQRTKEIGVRIALGATRRDVRRLVLGHTIRLVVIGAVLGIPAALAMARLLSGLLYQVDPYDPLAISLSVAVLVCVALASAYLPTQRAARIDPVKALRMD